MKSVNEIKKELFRYAYKYGGWQNIPEGDEYSNDLNRELIKAYASEHKEAYLGKINFDDKQKRKFIYGDESPLVKYEGQKIYNFQYDFIVPYTDKILIKYLKDWNTRGDIGALRGVENRVEKIGGDRFIWD